MTPPLIDRQSQERLIWALETYLDTRDKRFMFLRLMFPEVLPHIDLEGTPRQTAWAISNYFIKNESIGSLMKVVSNKLDADNDTNLSTGNRMGL